MCITVYQNFIVNAQRFIIEMRLHQHRARACLAVERQELWASVQHIFSPLLHCGWLLKSQNHPFFMDPPWTKCSLHKTSTMGSFSSHGKLGTNDALLLPASSGSLAFKSLPDKLFALMKSSKPVVKAPLRLYFPPPRQLQVLSSYTAVYHTQVYLCSCITKKTTLWSKQTLFKTSMELLLLF